MVSRVADASVRFKCGSAQDCAGSINQAIRTSTGVFDPDKIIKRPDADLPQDRSEDLRRNKELDGIN